jgi:hypothetical protein
MPACTAARAPVPTAQHGLLVDPPAGARATPSTTKGPADAQLARVVAAMAFDLPLPGL